MRAARRIDRCHEGSLDDTTELLCSDRGDGIEQLLSFIWRKSANSDHRGVERSDGILVEPDGPADQFARHVDTSRSVRQVLCPLGDVEFELRLPKGRERIVLLQKPLRRVVERVGTIGIPEDRPPQRHPPAGTNNAPELRQTDALTQ